MTATQSSGQPRSLPTRAEVPREQTWDIEALFATPQAWEAEAEALPGAGVQLDIRAAMDYALGRGVGAVGMVGFCWGGVLTWRAACAQPDLSAAVCYYGGGMTMPEEAARTPLRED